MPRFYFHIRDESGTVKSDDDGVELNDFHAAIKRAIQIGQHFLATEASENKLQPDDVARLAVEIRNHFGEVVSTVPFSGLSDR